jgi:hypothetical protein
MKIFYLIIIFLFISSFCNGKTVKVKGYFKKNGTYVSSHYRTSPDSSFYNNWSTKGNINPYTGKSGYKNYPNFYISDLSSTQKVQSTQSNQITKKSIDKFIKTDYENKILFTPILTEKVTPIIRCKKIIFKKKFIPLEISK